MDCLLFTRRSALYTDKIEKIIIPAECRKRMKRDLYRYGVHQASMFPGLDGYQKCSH